MVIWYDITNTPQVHFICAIVDALHKHLDPNEIISSRKFSETTALLKNMIEQDVIIIGEHHGKSRLRKTFGLLSRFAEVYKNIPKFDISISCGSESAVWTSFLRGKKSIAFGDNDLAKQWTYGKLVSTAFFPDSIPAKVLTSQGIPKKRLIRYSGYKEDIYLADYKPDPDFTHSIPFEHYVVLRPENLQANYIGNDQVKPITPELARHLINEGYNVLYLPRYVKDREFVPQNPKLFVPEKPINGLDACYFADAVLTGAGTFAREAACLGVPSFSFFAGKRLLAVDQSLIASGKMFHSRDVNTLLCKLKSSHKTEANLDRSKLVKEEVILKLKEVIQS